MVARATPVFSERRIGNRHIETSMVFPTNSLAVGSAMVCYTPDEHTELHPFSGQWVHKFVTWGPDPAG